MKPSDNASQCSGDLGAKARRKRREKRLDAGDIRLLILHFIAQGAAHGYELIKSIEDLSKGEYSPSPGIIYPNLTLLEETECIVVADPQAVRKAFRVTAVGQRQLDENQHALAEIIRRLTSMAVLVNNRTIPEIENALYRFRMVLNTRLSEQALSGETLQAIVDALEEAAEKIKCG